MNSTPPPLIVTPRPNRFPVMLKIAVICALVLLLHVPLFLTRGVLRERKSLESEAVQEIAGIWGQQQTFTGPVLEVPYRYSAWVTRNKLVNGRETAVTERVLTQASAYFLPETLAIKGEATPEIRKRGIYETVVYSTRVKVEASFLPSFVTAGIEAEEIDWDKARVLTGVSDLRGVRSVGPLTIVERTLSTKFETVEGNGHAFLPLAAKVGLEGEGKPLGVAFELSVQGSEQMSFVPLGKTTSVVLESPWPDPSFAGAYLPISRTIGGDGFKAEWAVSHFSRGLAQSWTDRGTDVNEVRSRMESSRFGVAFVRLVDGYRMVERAQKYGVLFFVLIFTVFFLFELTASLRIHPLQYALVGLALCLFFLGFLALSELMASGPAYAIAAGACTVLVTLYAWTFLKTGARALIIAIGLGGTYGYLYFMLKSEDYALIAGVLALFVGLGLVMFFTRRINWYGTEAREQT